MAPSSRSGSSPRNGAGKTGSEKTTARKYGFACANCRRRKAKCDGAMPRCERCLASGDNCHFNKVPSVAYSVALQDRLDVCENLLSRLRIAHDSERTVLLEEFFANGADKTGKRKRTGVLETSTHESPTSTSSSDNDLVEVLNETSVDDHGRISFYGSTSLFHVQPDKKTKPPSICTEPVDSGFESWSYESSSQIDPSITFDDGSPITSAAGHNDIATYLNVDVDSQVCNELLDTYWCWPHHLHLVLCRKIFMRDLLNLGPYVSPFLLNAVLAQAARYSDRPEAPQLGQIFAQKTLDTLAAEVEKGSSIPAIQGLLIFSARECACGRTSQGWLYSGMAFSMMRDMGIQIHPRKLSHLGGHFSAVELALRQQIFWSCYTWDKTMSLCLGRNPALHDTIDQLSNDVLLDGDEAENELWKPKFANTYPLQIGVPTQKARTNSRFVAYCHLCIIIDEVLATLYSKPQASQIYLRDFLDSTLGKLDTWANGLSNELFVREDSRTISCPPLHILLLNLLYHATIILLCRPYRTKQDRARKMATTAAEMIDRLFMLHIRRFRFRVITYLESYTMFVASTINILDLKDGIDAEAAGSRLGLSLEILRNATSTPSNARCVEIIEQLMRKDEISPVGQPRNRNLPQPVTASTPRRPSVQSVRPPQMTPPLFTPYTNQQHHIEVDGGDTPSLTSFSPVFTQPNMLASDTIQLPMSSQVETPMRWLADNVGTNTQPELWMMMDMDFNNFNNDPLMESQDL